MKRIDWENEPSTKTPLNAENLNLMQDNIQENINGYVLYENEEGSTGEITLNEEIENYDEYEIQYYLQLAARRIQKTTGRLNTKIDHVALEMTRITVDPKMQLISNILKVEGKNITRYTNMFATIDMNRSISATGTDVFFNITKVTGYKK